MKRWQVLAVLAMMIAVNLGGWTANKAYNGIESTMISGYEAGSEGFDILSVPLNPDHGMYYRCEISSPDSQRFSVLFANLSVLMAARIDGTPIVYDADRSALNVTSVTMEGRLPDSSDVYQLLIVSAEPGVMVRIASSGEQGAYPPSLRPVFQAAYIVCWLSSMILLFLLIHVYDVYRNERRRGY